MTIKEALAKVAKGETLTDEEKAFLAGYDPEKVQNDAAAASRRKAEAEVVKLQELLESLKTEKSKADRAAEEAKKSGMTEAQKLAKQIEDLTKNMADLKKAKDDADKHSQTLARKQRIATIRDGNKIRFIDGVDRKLVDGAFEAAFEGLDNFEDEDAVAERVKAFTGVNKALIVDDSGHGTGAESKPAVGLSGKAVDKMSDVERRDDLKKRGII